MSERVSVADRFLAGFAAHAASRPSPLLAYPLRRYAEAEGLDWNGLAERLGCSEAGLNRLAACRPPRPEQFLSDAEEIAAGTLPLERLLTVLRHLQVTEAFADRKASRSGEILSFETKAAARNYLLAARDASTEDTDDKDDHDGELL